MQRNTDEDLPLLHKFAEQLTDLGDKIFKSPIHYDQQNDHLGAMSLFFTSKQIVHIKSILLLCKNELYSDATIIARVMIEGMISLLWAGQNPDSRALNWRMYALVSDYRELQNRKSRGEQIPTKEEEDLKKRLVDCKRFLKKNAKTSFDKGDPLPNDPYRTKWLLGDDGKVLQTVEIFSEVDSKLYKLYSDLCDWIHWNPKGFTSMLSRKKEFLVFKPNPPIDGASALIAGFQSLLHSLELLNQHLGLGQENKLTEIKSNYIKELKLESDNT